MSIGLRRLGSDFGQRRAIGTTWTRFVIGGEKFNSRRLKSVLYLVISYWIYPSPRECPTT